MLIAAVVPSYASADSPELVNELTISTEVLTSAICIDETEIPAGTLSVSLNISNNNGFSSSLSKISIDGDYNIICNENNEPLTKKGTDFSDILVASAKNNDTIAICTSSFDNNDSEGEFVTFYVNAYDYESLDFDLSDYSFSSISNESLQSLTPQFDLNHIGGAYYCIGDVNFDNIIDGRDASATMYAVDQYNIYKQSHSGAPNHLTVSFADDNLSTFFASSATLCAKSADADETSSITNGDAQIILTYYSYDSVGNLDEFFDYYDYHLGENRFCGGSTS